MDNLQIISFVPLRCIIHLCIIMFFLIWEIMLYTVLIGPLEVAVI